MPINGRTTLSIPISPWGQAHILKANAGEGLDHLGFSVFGKSLIADANAAARRTAIDAQRRQWTDVTEYGADKTGVADSTAAIQAAATAAAGGVLLIPEGVFSVNLTITIPANTLVMGLGPGSVVQVDGAVSAFTTSGGRAEFHNLKIDGNLTGSGIYFAGSHDLVRVVGCQFVDCRVVDAIYGASADTQTRIEITGCKVTNGLDGIYFPGKYGSAVIAGNLIDGLAEAAAVHGVHLGNNTATDWDEMTDAVVSDNTIRNVTSTGVDVECHAIMVYGERALVIGNRISTVTNNAASASGGEAIYTKSPYGQIIGNIVVDGGRTSNGAICTKSSGYPVLISGNIVLEAAITNAVGIFVTSDNSTVVDNLLVGLSGVAISLGAADSAAASNVNICRNRVYNHKGNIAIIIEPGGGSGIRVNDNVIDGLLASEGVISHAYGIQILAEAAALSDVEVCRNIIRDASASAATSSVRCIFVQNPDVGSTINGLRIEGNTFSVVSATLPVYGVYFSLGARAVTALRIANNSSARLSGTSATPVFISAADAAVCTLKDHSGNDFAGATGLGAARCAHSYGGAAVAWTMTTGEAWASLFEATNASGPADAVFPAAVPGKVFTVYNNSGAAITFKVSGQAGSAVATGKRAIFTMSSTDCVELYEQP